MEEGLGSLLIAARAVHFASAASLVGALYFRLFVVLPSLAATGAGVSPPALRLDASLSRIVWLSLVLALFSGSVCLALFVAEMSGAPLDEALTSENFRLALFQTQTGTAWGARFLLALALAALLVVGRWAGLQAILATGVLAGLAWNGHAGGGQGEAGAIHAASDVVHLIATGAWLGGLAPLALMLSYGRQASAGTGWAVMAAMATRRFSALAALSVAALIGTGVVNAWILVGSIPALLGTAYGRLLLLKIGLLLAMLAIAAVNRLKLTSALVSEGGAAATDRLTRNALFETGLGAAILVVVALFGVMPPGAHEQPIWPFSVRLETSALVFPPKTGELVVPAHPTSFQTSPNRYSAQTIAAGAALYGQHCARCHGATGEGNGPDARGATKPPSDLTSHGAHARLPGERFWDIAHVEGHPKPKFADELDATARWRLVDFLHALGDAAHLRMQDGAVTAAAVRTPGFSADCPSGLNVSLDELRGRIVRLVMAGAASAGRFAEADAPAFGLDGGPDLATVVLPLADASGVRWPVCAAGDHKATEAFAVYVGGSAADGAELLIDGAGLLRFAWRPSVRGERLAPAMLRQRIDEIQRTPGEPVGGGGRHH